MFVFDSARILRKRRVLKAEMVTQRRVIHLFDRDTRKPVRVRVQKGHNLIKRDEDVCIRLCLHGLGLVIGEGGPKRWDLAVCRTHLVLTWF